MINFQGKAKRLEDIDLPRIGREIGVGEDEVHAVLEVESSGSGFDKKGRPKALFEPHVFYRNLPAGPRRERAVAEGLAYAKWIPGKYPPDSYARIVAAIAIDETAALKATSWGLGQVLGENHKMAGCATVQDMVRACVDDEENHLLQMINFIKNKKLDDDLRRHDWAGFAKGYNGERYAEHNYHGRLAAAYAKWQKIKDTPFTLEDLRANAAKEEADAQKIKPLPDAVIIKPPLEKPKVSTETKISTIAIGAGGAGAAIAKKQGIEWGTILGFGACFAVIVVAIILIIRRNKS